MCEKAEEPKRPRRRRSASSAHLASSPTLTRESISIVLVMGRAALSQVEGSRADLGQRNSNVRIKLRFSLSGTGSTSPIRL